MSFRAANCLGRGASRDRCLPLVAGERRRPVQHHDEALLNVVFQVLARGAHREILPSCGRSRTSLEVLTPALTRARDRRVPRDEAVDVLERRQRCLVHVNTRGRRRTPVDQYLYKVAAKKYLLFRVSGRDTVSNVRGAYYHPG